jgi:hypothetical protein
LLGFDGRATAGFTEAGEGVREGLAGAYELLAERGSCASVVAAGRTLLTTLGGDGE